MRQNANIYEALKEAEAEIAATEKDIRDLQGRLDQLRLEKRGLESWIARHNGQPAEDDWGPMPRTTAVERILTRERRPIGPAEIARLLGETGRAGDSPAYVSAALAYLKRMGRVVQAGPGRWIVQSTEARQAAEGGG